MIWNVRFSQGISRISNYRVGGNRGVSQSIDSRMQSNFVVNCGGHGLSLSLAQIVTIIAPIGVSVVAITTVRITMITIIASVPCVRVGIGLRLCQNCDNSESYEQLKKVEKVML